VATPQAGSTVDDNVQIEKYTRAGAKRTRAGLAKARSQTTTLRQESKAAAKKEERQRKERRRKKEKC
jgi:hypothetical protein